jgi:hypothetical protein
VQTIEHNEPAISVVGINGSLRDGSYTQLALNLALQGAEEVGAGTQLIDLREYDPPRADRSWITAAGAVLDAAALTQSTVDIPADPQAALCIRAGYLALRQIAEFFSIPYNPNPDPTDPINVTRQEFDAACERLEAAGVPLKPDRDQAWRDFSGWRVNYDSVLLDLAGLVVAPEAPWSGDRASAFRMSPIRRKTRRV